MAAFRIILMLLLLLIYTQEIGSGSECESQCDCNIRLMNNGTMSWTFSTPMCITANQVYIITKTQGASENILSCTCSSGQPDCRDIKPGYNYSIEKNRIVLTRNTSNEGTFQFETLPLNEKCRCEIFAQVPYVPEEDTTTSTTRNPHPATTLTTSSTTPTQGARSESNTGSLFAAIVPGFLFAVLFVVFIGSHLYVHKKHKNQLQKRDKRILKLVDERLDKNQQIWDLKLELQESQRIRNLELNTNNPQGHTSVTILNEVQPGTTTLLNTDDTNEESIAETAERERNTDISNGHRHDPPTPSYGAASLANSPVSSPATTSNSSSKPSTIYTQNTTPGISVLGNPEVQYNPNEKLTLGSQFAGYSVGVATVSSSIPEQNSPENGPTEQDADIMRGDDAPRETDPFIPNVKPRENSEKADSQGVRN